MEVLRPNLDLVRFGSWWGPMLKRVSVGKEGNRFGRTRVVIYDAGNRWKDGFRCVGLVNGADGLNVG
jgi:hypothetical protein